jgi:hypothetical protein
VTEAVLALEVNNLALVIEVRVQGKYSRERVIVCDAAERSSVRWMLKKISEGGFHKVHELLIGCVL